MGVGLVTTVLLAFAVEGAFSIWRGRPLLRRALDPTARMMDGWDDAQRSRLAQLTEGPFDLDADPEVGHRVKAGSSYAWLGAPAHTDGFGMRTRPQGWPQDGSPRWVVLGDSIAFGLGVRDDETYAARIERRLSECWNGEGKSPAVLTVASPGWNLESSTRWMRNHAHRYEPSLVVLLPVDNDLENRFVPSASGGRSYGIDPVHGQGRIHVSSESFTDLRVAMTGRAPLDRVASVLGDGGLVAVEHALTAGLAPESIRRYDEAVESIVRLRDELARRSCKLAVLCTWDSHFMRELEARLRQRAPDLMVSFVFDEWQKADALIGDGHPNPLCIDAGSVRILQEIGRHGLLPPQAKPERMALPAEFQGRIAQPRTGSDAQSWLTSRQKILEKHSGPRIDLRDGTGFQQIYAGVDPDGTVGGQAEFCLRRKGDERGIALEIDVPIGGTNPMRLSIRLGMRTGPGDHIHWTNWTDTNAVDADRSAPRPIQIELPSAARGVGWMDVRLEADNHVVETVAGKSRVAALRLISAKLVD